jgi:hypothetical protein
VEGLAAAAVICRKHIPFGRVTTCGGQQKKADKSRISCCPAHITEKYKEFNAPGNGGSTFCTTGQQI